MSCLLCLRNEGIHFPNESTNDFQILLQLFSLPQEFSQNLEGNKCCSLCRVKLQFVQVLNEEIFILGEKLKCFEKEVKGIFVRSFEGNRVEIENDEPSNEARRKLFKELNIFNSEISSGEIPNLKIEKDEIFKEYEEVESTLVDPFADSQFINPNDQPMNEETEEKQETFRDDLNEESFEFPTTSSTHLLNSSNNRRSKWFKKVTKPKESNFKTPANYMRNDRKMCKYSCKMCPKKIDFYQNEEFENHLQTVHPTRQYSTCPICTRIILEVWNFTESQSRTKLKDHMEIHTGNRPYPCDLCDLSFKRNSDLKNHKETHFEREMIPCDLCGKETRGERNMNVHLRKHGNWNFNCPFCGLKSRTEGGPNLEQHLKANCGERKTRK